MPELTPAQIVMLVAVFLFTAVAAISDLRTRKIPNYLTAPMCLMGLVYQIGFFGLDGFWSALAGFGAGFGIFFVLWMIGTAGGGDVKLMGALGPWLGAIMVLKVMFVSMLFVIVGTAAIVLGTVFRKGFRRTKSQFVKSSANGKAKHETSEQRQKRRVMAFAAPVALATWAVLALQLFGSRG
jgi:prepilin peptidase CpaA